MPALLALLAAALWGTSDFVGGILSRRLPALTVVFFGQCASLLVLGALSLAVHPPLRAALPDAAAAGVLGTIALVCFYGAMGRGQLSLVAPLTATGIAIPVAWDLAHGTPADLLQSGGMLLSFTGAILAGGPEFRRAPQAARITMLLTVAAAVCFGVYYIFVAQGSRHSVLGTLLTQRATGVVLLAYLGPRGLRAGAGAGAGAAPDTAAGPPGPGATAGRGPLRGLRGLRASLPGALLILLPLGGLAEMSANGLYGLAVVRPGANPAVVTILVSLYPVMTTLLARFALHERLRTVQNIGITAALAGVLLLNA
jgi:drug/metabolite transporter (DMT)-like permease